MRLSRSAKQRLRLGASGHREHCRYTVTNRNAYRDANTNTDTDCYTEVYSNAKASPDSGTSPYSAAVKLNGGQRLISIHATF